MTDEQPPLDDMIQGFLDGRLNRHDRARVAAYLLSHPEFAENVRKMLQLDARIKHFGRQVLEEPVPDKLSDLISDAVVNKREKGAG